MRCGGSLGPGAGNLEFSTFPGAGTRKTRGFGPLGGGKSKEQFQKETFKILCFCSQNDVFARFGYVFDPQNTAKPSENVILRGKTVYYSVFVCFYMIFVFLAPPGEPRAAPGAPQGVPEALQTLLGGPNGASREPPGVLLERSWRLLRRSRGALDGSWRLLAAPRALPGRFWRSPGALLGPFGAPALHSRAFYFPEKRFVLAFYATATETATASWYFALEALDQLGL